MKTSITIFVADSRGDRRAVGSFETDRWLPLDPKYDMKDFAPAQITQIELHNDKHSHVWPVYPSMRSVHED